VQGWTKTSSRSCRGLELQFPSILSCLLRSVFAFVALSATSQPITVVRGCKWLFWPKEGIAKLLEIRECQHSNPCLSAI